MNILLQHLGMAGAAGERPAKGRDKGDAGFLSLMNQANSSREKVAAAKNKEQIGVSLFAGVGVGARSGVNSLKEFLGLLGLSGKTVKSAGGLRKTAVGEAKFPKLAERLTRLQTAVREQRSPTTAAGKKASGLAIKADPALAADNHRAAGMAGNKGEKAQPNRRGGAGAPVNAPGPAKTAGAFAVSGAVGDGQKKTGAVSGIGRAAAAVRGEGVREPVAEKISPQIRLLQGKPVPSGKAVAVKPGAAAEPAKTTPVPEAAGSASGENPAPAAQTSVNRNSRKIDGVVAFKVAREWTELKRAAAGRAERAAVPGLEKKTAKPPVATVEKEAPVRGVAVKADVKPMVETLVRTRGNPEKTGAHGKQSRTGSGAKNAAGLVGTAPKKHPGSVQGQPSAGKQAPVAESVKSAGETQPASMRQTDRLAGGPAPTSAAVETPRADLVKPAVKASGAKLVDLQPAPAAMAQQPEAAAAGKTPGAEAAVNRGAWLSQAHEAVRQAYVLRPRSVTVKLVPEELGELRVRVALDQDQLQAKIQTETQRVAAVLRDHQSELEHRLREQGVDLHRLEIREEARDGSRQQARHSFTQADGGRDGRGQGGSDDERGEAKTTAAAETAGESAEEAAERPELIAGRLSVMA